MDSSSTSQDVGLQVELLENSFAKVAPQADAFATSFTTICLQIIQMLSLCFTPQT